MPGTGRRICETVHILALALWLGALLMGGTVAAVAFPVMRSLEPTLGAFEAYAGDHAPLAAGQIAGRVFLVTDAVQFIAAFVVLATTVALVSFLHLPLRRWSSAIRLVAVGGAILVVSYQLLVLGPRMTQNLHQYWQLAEAGNTEGAEAARLAFSDDHPTATRVLSGTAALVALALAAGIWSAAGAGSKRDADDDSAPGERHPRIRDLVGGKRP